MGMWDEMCVVCGGPLRAPVLEDLLYGNESEADANFMRAQNLEGLEWLEDRIGISEKEEVLTLGEESGYGSFDLDEHKEFSGATIFRATMRLDGAWPEGDPHGLTCHRKCYELLERDLQYTLRFHNVWPMLMQQEHGTWLDCTDYGGMAKYIENDGFCFMTLYQDGNRWMFEDPTTNQTHGERISKLWHSIIQSGFQVKAEERGEDGSHVGHGTASETAIHSVGESEGDSLSQNLHLYCNL